MLHDPDSDSIPDRDTVYRRALIFTRERGPFNRVWQLSNSAAGSAYSSLPLFLHSATYHFTLCLATRVALLILILAAILRVPFDTHTIYASFSVPEQ